MEDEDRVKRGSDRAVPAEREVGIVIRQLTAGLLESSALLSGGKDLAFKLEEKGYEWVKSDDRPQTTDHRL